MAAPAIAIHLPDPEFPDLARGDATEGIGVIGTIGVEDGVSRCKPIGVGDFARSPEYD
jgi:hypothetical protein